MSGYRSLLLELSNNLTTADLEALKFLCEDVISIGRLEKITRGFELFGALEQRNMLSEENRDFLASKLIAVNRSDLRNKLLGIQEEPNVIAPFQAGAAVMVHVASNPYNRQVSDTLLHDLVEDLSTSWKMLGRRLGIPEGAITNIDMERRRVVEKGMAMFAEWKRRKGEGATVGVLREALDKTGRRDLSERVRDLVLAEQQPIMNTIITGTPIEERQPFPGLNELRPALPTILPIAPIDTVAQQQRQQPSDVLLSTGRPQEQAEPSNQAPISSTNQSTGSTRVPAPPGTVDTFSRQPIPEHGTGSVLHMEDFGRTLDESALPTTPPIAPINTVAQREPQQPSEVLVSTGRPQEPAEPSNQAPISSTNQSTGSTRVPAPPGTVDTFSRQPIPEHGTGSVLHVEDFGRTLDESALPTTPINTVAQREPQQPSDVLVSTGRPQEPAEPSNQAPTISTNQSTGSTRPETVDTFSREPIHGQGTEDVLDAIDFGGTLDELTDDILTDDAVSDDHVDFDLKRKLQFEGMFLDPEKYDPVRMLGSGGFGKVFLVIEKETDRKMACKMFDLGTINRRTQQVMKSTKREVESLSILRHEHIVKYIAFEAKRKTALLFLEYMEGGTLKGLLDQAPLQEPLVKKFTRQLLTAVNYLHTYESKRVIHRDIKALNILLDGPRASIKLADFGICTFMEDLRTVTGGVVAENTVGSLYWTSPEVLAGKAFGRNTDIWSVGCTVIEMLTGNPPLFGQRLDREQVTFRIIRFQVYPPENCSPAAHEFLKLCLRPRSQRPSAQALLQNPFLSDVQQ